MLLLLLDFTLDHFSTHSGSIPDHSTTWLDATKASIKQRRANQKPAKWLFAQLHRFIDYHDLTSGTAQKEDRIIGGLSDCYAVNVSRGDALAADCYHVPDESPNLILELIRWNISIN